MARPSPFGRPVDLDGIRNLTLREATRRLYPGYGPALGRLPRGLRVFRGLPFDLGRVTSRRWILVDAPLTIDLGRAAPTSHLIVAHLCDTWRDEDGSRPAGVAVGHVVPVGEPLARYTVEDRRGRRWSRVVRRRFEINDGLLGWGSGAFAAVSHLDNEVADWRGPHAFQTPGRYAPAGQSGSLTIMPGTYGPNQTGVSDFVPSAGDDALLWLHAIELAPDAEPSVMHVEPLAAGRAGSAVLIAAITLYGGSKDPLVRSPRFQVRVRGMEGAAPEVDLGTVIRVRRAAPPRPVDGARNEPPTGWGAPRLATPDDARIVDLSVAPDAIVAMDDWSIPGRALLEGSPPTDPAGRRSIEVLPAAAIPVEVELVDPATREPIAARVRFIAADGRYLPPAGHRDEVNPGFFEDTGGDLVLGPATYAYVPGSFLIELPAGRVQVEVVAGFERPPVRTFLDIDPSTRRLELALDHAFDLHLDRWMTADSHVHFLAPTTALLQAAAEDIDLVNLLAAQWGDLFTNVTDLPWGSISDPSGRRQVVVGTENRQNMLGHLALLGARRPIHPLSSAGPPEGRMAGALNALLADWADRCRAAGGLVVGAHFPLPYAEIAADIVTGRIDAIESQALAPRHDDPSILEWYRFLNLGYRLPIVAGTDKMSAEVPVGAVRTYTHLLPGDASTFEAWAAAVRAGRTFVSSGPVIELTLEGHEPGDVIHLPSRARLEAHVRARATQPVITDLELIVNGRVVAAVASAESTELTLHETISVEAGSWVAARSRSPFEIQSAFATSMAAHTSPVYVEVSDRPLVPSMADAAVVEQVMLGARTWVAELAAVAAPGDRARMVEFLDASLAILRRRMGRSLS